MKKQLLVLLILLTSAVAAFTQAPASSKQSQTEKNIRSHITFLASDALEGRRTGEPGASAAARYISDRFSAAKLRPGAISPDGKPAFLQSFPYIKSVEMAKSGNAFSLTLADSDVQVGNAESFVPVTPVGFSPNGSVEKAPVIFAGFGMTSKEPAFDDYAGLDVAGKVVLVFDGVPDNDNPHSPFGKFDPRTKALIAKDHGATGVLLISREMNFTDDRLTKMGYDQSLGESALPTFVISRKVAQTILGIDETALKGLEETISTGKGTPSNTHLEHRPTVTFKVNLVKQSSEAFNVVGFLPGNDPALKDEVIVIGAHYDHLGHGGNGSLAANSSEIHHGADDNASGTAAVIELARQFANAKNNKRTLVFMCFSGEEEGLLGSDYYVKHPLFQIGKTIAMINMDMIGRLKDNKLTVGGIGSATEWKGLVENTNRSVLTQSASNSTGATGSASGDFVLQLNEDGFGPSDHSSFYSKKVPVLFFFTGTHNDYHKPSDTADKINYEGELRVIDYVRAVAKAIDENPKIPTYTVAKSSMTGSRTGFNISLGTIPNYAESTDGLLLDGVRDGSPAALAGVRAGDKVVRLAGHDVRNVMDYTYVLGEMKAGQEYEIVVLRGTERLSFKITPVKR